MRITHAMLVALVALVALIGAAPASAQDAGTLTTDWCASIAPGTPEADPCAEAEFRAADAIGQAFDGFTLPPLLPWPPQSGTIDARVADIWTASDRTPAIVESYDRILRWNRPLWTIAALVREGQMYETLARAILTAPGSSGAPPGFDDRVRQAMESQNAPMMCLALVRYLLAVRVARFGALHSPYAATALDRLIRYPASELATCVEAQRIHDHSFSTLTPHDLADLPR